jgi:hypothetical protein
MSFSTTKKEGEICFIFFVIAHFQGQISTKTSAPEV